MSIKPTGYSGTPLAKKLGIVTNSRVFAKHAPGEYARLLEPVPPGTVFESVVGLEVSHSQGA